MLGLLGLDRRRTLRAEATDRRVRPRRRVLLRGKIVYGPGFTADCTIRDLSPDGACVVMPSHQACPTDSYLIVVREGAAHRARIRWALPPLAGLAFDASYDFHKDTPPHMRRVRELWMALAPDL